MIIKGNFLGAAIVAIIYTVYILHKPITTNSKVLLVILNALTIVLMAFAFKQ